MKSFAYTAKNQRGELVSGVLETKDFLDASLNIKNQGLELLSLNERDQIHQLTPFIFDAVDAQGEPVQGTIKAADEDEVKKKLQQEFGYQVKSVHAKAEHASTQVIKATAKPPEHDRSEAIAKAKEALSTPTQQAAEEKIIFKREAPVIHTRPEISDAEINAVAQGIDLLLAEKSGKISPAGKERLNHLRTMIALARQHQDKKRWKNLKREIHDAEEIIRREIKEKEDQEWKAMERQDPGKKIDSYTQFSDKPKPIFATNGKMAKWIKLARQIDLPDENNEAQVLLKQQYESVWFELQRFSGALFAFYLIVLFAAYYLKRSGVSDHVLIRIYDTTIFKQLIVSLFSLYALLTLRNEFLPKRIKTDAVSALVWIVLLGLIFW